MFRSVVLLSFVTLSLFASCVDVSTPSEVSECERNHNCTNGPDGATAGAGGHSADAGAGEVPEGGQGGSGGTISSTGGGGSTAGSGGKGGTGGNATGGTSGLPDGGTEPTPDAAPDKPAEDPDVPLDTKPDAPADTNTGPETGPVPGPDGGPDSSPDLTPDSPDTLSDAPTCIQSFKSNGYALLSSDGGIKACSECKDNNGVSLETPCKAMIDCLVPVWVCKPGDNKCWVTCRNNTPGGDMVLDACVSGLVNKACF